MASMSAVHRFLDEHQHSEALPLARCITVPQPDSFAQFGLKPGADCRLASLQSISAPTYEKAPCTPIVRHQAPSVSVETDGESHNWQCLTLQTQRQISIKTRLSACEVMTMAHPSASVMESSQCESSEGWSGKMLIIILPYPQLAHFFHHCVQQRTTLASGNRA
jgi:hypothetical protein